MQEGSLPCLQSSLTERRLLGEASAPVLARVREDADAAPELIRAAFVLIERGLFESKLSRSELEGSCPAAGRAFFDLWRESTGVNPGAYVRARRMDVAKALMRRFELKTHQIARLVGYGTYRGFAYAFQGSTGQTPVEWRARFSAPEPSGELPRAERLQSWRRAFLGVADEELLGELVEKMMELYPRLREDCCELFVARKLARERESELLESGDFRRAYEEFKAKRIVEVLERSDVQVSAKLRLVEGVPVSSLVLLDRLLERASKLASEDLERSLEWSRFAVSSLEPWKADTREEVADRRVLALAQLARTSFAVGRADEGYEALALAELKCRRPFESIDPLARGVLLEARVARQRLEVCSTVAEAMEVYRGLGDEDGMERVRRLGA